MRCQAGPKLLGRCRCSNRLYLSSGPLLLLSLVLPATSFAQVATSSAVTAPSTGLTSATSLTSTTFATITSAPLTTSATHNTTSNSTTTSATDTTYFVGSDGDGDPTKPDHNTSLLNYYFVFLAILAILLFAAVYSLHRRKKKLKAQFRSTGQNALARDLDGWVAGRRWIHGNWRNGYGGEPERREDGLNELGEAPPPYKARPESLEPQPHGGDPGSPSSGLTVPLQTLSRDGRATLKPPGYAETIRSPSVSSLPSVRHDDSRPATSRASESIDISRPPTAAVSTRDLLSSSQRV